MRKPLYNIVIFIFHIITLILLFTLCIHFNVIKLDFLDSLKEAVASFFKNDYVVNIVCTILTAAVLYIIQKYSLQGTTQGRYLTGGVPPVRFSM